MMTRNKALFHMHFATVLFGLSGVFGALVHASAVVIVWGRALWAWLLLSLLALLWRRSPWAGLQGRDIGRLLLSGVLLAAHWLTFFMAIHQGGVAIGTLGFSCFPAMTALLESLFFKEKIAVREWTLVALVSLGLILVTPDFNLGNQATMGLIWGIVSGSLYALLAMFNRLAAARADTAQACWWQYLAIVAVTSPWVWPHWPHVSGKDWAWIAAIGLLCTGWAYHLFIRSLRVLNARTAAMVIALEPVYAIAIAWVWLAQVPNGRMLLGGGLIISAVLAASRRT